MHNASKIKSLQILYIQIERFVEWQIPLYMIKLSFYGDVL